MSATAIRGTPLIDVQATDLTRPRYERLAAHYDRLESLSERRYCPWRRQLWGQVIGSRVLDVGVGAGNNMPYWPAALAIKAIDLTPGMLALARRRANQLGLQPDLRLGDVQALEFPEATFDSAVAILVFCSVPDPVRGLIGANLNRRTVDNARQTGIQVISIEELAMAGMYKLIAAQN